MERCLALKKTRTPSDVLQSIASTRKGQGHTHVCIQQLLMNLPTPTWSPSVHTIVAHISQRVLQLQLILGIQFCIFAWVIRLAAKKPYVAPVLQAWHQHGANMRHEDPQTPCASVSHLNLFPPPSAAAKVALPVNFRHMWAAASHRRCLLRTFCAWLAAIAPDFSSKATAYSPFWIYCRCVGLLTRFIFIQSISMKQLSYT